MGLCLDDTIRLVPGAFHLSCHWRHGHRRRALPDTCSYLWVQYNGRIFDFVVRCAPFIRDSDTKQGLVADVSATTLPFVRAERSWSHRCISSSTIDH
jgi:hypothetical protein